MARLIPSGVSAARFGLYSPPVAFWSLYGLLALALLVSLPARATSKVQTFHIEAGDATLTLNEFSRQSSLQLLFDYNIVRGRKTRAVRGEYAPAAALEQMLADTGLVFDFVNDRTLAVTSRTPGGTGSAVADLPPVRGSHTYSAERQTVQHNAPGSGELGSDPKAPEIEEVRITGTLLRGEAPVGEHVTRLDRDDINASPAATVQDLLHALPQAFGGGPSEDTHFFPEAGTNSGLGSGVNLRGLGARATLVLVNGKRLAPGGTEASFADIENIPLSAVERVDILPDSASAMYGADAVGGVVNFVMRDDFTGGETVVRGGHGTRNTLTEYRMAETLGKRWDSGNGMLSLEFYKREALPADARRYATSNLTSLGGDNFDTFLSNPGNITVGQRSYAIPTNQNGTGLTAADFTPDTQNLSERYSGADILPSQKRWSLYASGKQALHDSMAVYGNAMVSQRDARQRTGGFTTDFQVPNSNPFYVNPTGGTDRVTVDYNFLDDIGPLTTDVLVNTLNVTLGLDIAVGSAWKVNLYTNYAQERENQFTGGQLDFAALSQALSDPDPQTAFNPFGDGSHTNPATLRSIATGTRYYTNSKLRSGAAVADGPLAHLPGGDVKLAFGADHRNQVFTSLQTETSTFPAIEFTGSRNVTAAFGEIIIPLFGKDNARSGLRRLELSLAGRYEDYSDFGHAATPKLAMAWSPFEAVALRGTWGRSVRAPTLADKDASHNLIIPYVLADKISPTGFSSVLIESGRNPALTVEHARSWTAGFDIDPRQWVAGLTFSATYFDIHFRDRIQTPFFTANVLNDPTFTELISRNLNPTQIASTCGHGQYAGGTTEDCLQYPAAVILDIRSQNRESVRTRGFDLSTLYERSWSPGTLKLRLDGTYLLDFTEQQSPGAPAAQLLNTQNNPINIKLRSTASWHQPRWGATLGINFQNHYTDTASEPNRYVRSYTTFDAQLRYDLAPFSTGFLQNTLVELNAINVFNVSPPFLNNQIAALGYDQENADPYGRLVSLQVRKTW
ncbi:MAG: TonB-dependent receptor domain-containing protein [Steroidobacteraceae bacterium]